MSDDRCYATVLLDEEVRRSLAALISERDVAWLYRCVLESGHRGEHLAEPQGAGSLNCWVRWNDAGQARISTTGQPQSPGREPRGQGGAGAGHSAAGAGHSAADAAQQPDAPSSGSQAEALWAIAAALQHLADVIAGALGADDDDTGRHGVGRAKGS